MTIRIADAIGVRASSKIVGYAAIVRDSDAPGAPAIDHAEGSARLKNRDS